MNVSTSESLFQRRWKKFKSLKRGYYSFRVLIGLYLLSFLFPFLINSEPLVVCHEGRYDFPVMWDLPFIGHLFKTKLGRDYGMKAEGFPDWQKLKEKYEKENSGNWLLFPLYDKGPYRHYLDLEGRPPHPPSARHWAGTDMAGRDIFSRLSWGFNVSISFALLVTFFNYLIGISVGALLVYFGGKVDIFGQRFIEIFSAIPFLYFVMIIGDLFRVDNAIQSFFVMVAILSLLSWMGMTYFIRGEFYREKSKDYVAAAIAQGESDRSIIFRHILPNALTPVVTFAPFAIVGMISALVSLDFLGFGLPIPTPSWGELVNQGMDQLDAGKWWLIAFPLGAMFCTLMLVTFIGEAIREAFDPKVFSRLR
jgi:microcin C transport system permease protein